MFTSELQRHLEGQLRASEALLEAGLEDVRKWQEANEALVASAFGAESRYAEKLRAVSFANDLVIENLLYSGKKEGIKAARKILLSIIGDSLPESLKVNVSKIQRICDRFHLFVEQLSRRHNQRPSIEISDEYDQQDVFHAVLRLSFDDVRAEDYVPSHAGSSSRVDFFLPMEGIAIELKKTRRNLRDSDLGEQLLVDIGRYSTNRNYQALLFFVYDPDRLIENPAGLIRDAEARSNGLFTRIFINQG